MCLQEMILKYQTSFFWLMVQRKTNNVNAWVNAGMNQIPITTYEHKYICNDLNEDLIPELFIDQITKCRQILIKTFLMNQQSLY